MINAEMIGMIQMTPKTPYTGFRKLRPEELDAGYAVLVDAYEYLKSKGSPQWPRPFPYEKYCRWHRQGLNYAIFKDGAPAAVLSLVEEPDDRWRGFLAGACVFWIRAVAGSRRKGRKGFGKKAVRAAVERIVVSRKIPLYLHCFKGSGFLPEYYGGLGFEWLGETELDNGPWVLMKHPVPDKPERSGHNTSFSKPPVRRRIRIDSGSAHKK